MRGERGEVGEVGEGGGRKEGTWGRGKLVQRDKSWLIGRLS